MPWLGRTSICFSNWEGARDVTLGGREVPLSILPATSRTLTSAWFSPQGRVKLPSHSDVSPASHCLSGSYPILLPPCPFHSVVRAVGGVLWPCLLFFFLCLSGLLVGG